MSEREQYLVIRAGKKYTGKNLYHHGYDFGYRNNSTFGRGMGGVIIFRRGADPTSTRLLIDWAKIASPDASSAYGDEMLFFEDKILPLEIFKEDIRDMIEDEMYGIEEQVAVF